MSELHWLSAGAARAAIAKRELSPVELVRALLNRIARLDPRLNAFIRIEADAALKEARVAEA
jgi:aspartyl-tRNA(Asn)/glutamyl-tRNA(Gln) amidotransferase subunit A